ncbi:MAG: sigma-54-dependent Fis family transcriptional regulator, partial [Proteobacteria bacterium]|nr:sigma-54-dependent Fis family transcriptional regulator [Pseudomonadota bacterium]
VFPIEVPALRERVEDIPHLAELFLRKLNKLNSKEIHYIDPRVMVAFKRYSWPGNIRELENLIERAYLLEKSSVLTPESFPGELFAHGPLIADTLPNLSCSLAEVRRQSIETYLRNLLSSYKGRIQKSADVAGISTRQMHKLMKQHGMKKEDFKLSPH